MHTLIVALCTKQESESFVGTGIVMRKLDTRDFCGAERFCDLGGGNSGVCSLYKLFYVIVIYFTIVKSLETREYKLKNSTSK